MVRNQFKCLHCSCDFVIEILGIETEIGWVCCPACGKSKPVDVEEGSHNKLPEFEERAIKARTDKELADIMTEMEQCYSIPSLMNKQYEEANQEIIKLYRHTSNRRSL